MEKVLIVIPARYDSSRLPGKPLVKIKGIEMIKRSFGYSGFLYVAKMSLVLIW